MELQFEFVPVIMWFGGQLWINFLSKILKFFIIAQAFTVGEGNY